MVYPEFEPFQRRRFRIPRRYKTGIKNILLIWLHGCWTL